MENDDLQKDAYEYYGVSTLEEVLEKAAKNIETSPTDKDYWYRGMANFLINIETSLTGKVPLYRSLANIFMKKDKKLIEDFTKAIEINPGNAKYYFVRGGLREYLGDVNEAIKDYDKAIELDSNNFQYYFKRGDLKRRFNDAKGAKEDLKKAIDLSQNVLDENRRRIIVEMYNEIELNPKFAEGYNHKGKLKNVFGEK